MQSAPQQHQMLADSNKELLIQNYCVKQCSLGSQCRSYCIDMHHYTERRRNPYSQSSRDGSFAYQPQICSSINIDVQPNGSTQIEGKCSKGDSCLFAHTLNEVRFHPLKFKMSLCADFIASGQCKNIVCHQAHFQHELRQKSTMDMSQPNAPMNC